MARYKLTLEYEGTRYQGWQIQPQLRTVQGELIQVARDFFQTRELDIQGSGRTDAGVHAFGQVAHLDLPGPIKLAPGALAQALNERLPSDIHILDIEAVAPDFHARHSAKYRSYIYQIAKRRNAFGKKLAWWVREDLDSQAMLDAGAVLEGMHDFTAFTDPQGEQKHNRVAVEAVQIFESEDLIIVRLLATHFLQRMVRRIVGCLVEVGKGRMSMKVLKNQLTKPDYQHIAQFTAPASGLFLAAVYYEGEEPILEPERMFWG